MLTILASGKLLRDPQRRTSAAGKTYATALLSVPTDDSPVLVSAIAFGATAEKLLAHGEGDTLSVLGKAKLSTWDKDGEQKYGLSLTVDKWLSPYELTKRRNAVNGEPKSAHELIE